VLVRVIEAVDPGLRNTVKPNEPNRAGLADALTKDAPPAVDPQTEFYRQEALKKAHLAQLRRRVITSNVVRSLLL